MAEDINFEQKEKKLMEYVEKFSFPRLAGSEGEREAVKLTINTFKDIGYEENQIEKLNFEFSTFYSEELIKIIGFMNILLIFTLLLIKYIYPYSAIITGIIFLLLFLSMLKVLKHPELKGFWEKHFGTFISATNVIIKIPPNNIKNGELSRNIVVSAHLDSKSQTFKTFWRVVFFSIWQFGIIIFIILFVFFIIDLYFYLFRSILLSLEISTIITASLIIFSILMIILTKTRNLSLGSLDNASGMALIFMLSSYFRDKPLKNSNLWLCQFSAEEIGTMGSRVFLDTFEEQLVRSDTFQINFDMVSCQNHKNEVEYIKSYGIFPKKEVSSILSRHIREIAKEKDITIRGHTLLSGAHTDSVPFHLVDLKTIDFSTPLAAKYSHSKEDTPKRVNPKVLLDTFIIIQNLVLRLDKN
ncbi:MAG: M28 family peptidase [Promethearchaeota archaeon]